MKKFLAVSAALSLALSLAACGGSASSSAAASTPASTPASSAAASSGAAAEGNGDWAAIQEKGTLVVGMTIFDPMNYYDADGNLIGFDTELAQAVGEKLGVEVQFQEIEWNNKVMELDAGNIDCVWNGMTILDDLKDAMDFSIPYSGNMQVPVINVANADTYTSVESMNSPDVTVAAESGSAGEGAIDDNMPDANKLTVTAQRDCLTELKSGTIDVGVIEQGPAGAGRRGRGGPAGREVPLRDGHPKGRPVKAERPGQPPEKQKNKCRAGPFWPGAAFIGIEVVV